MKIFLKSLTILAMCVCLGCGSENGSSYEPSIASLKPGETLVMKYKACHNGCTKGVVKFMNGNAIIGRHRLELSTQEIAELDHYFSLGEDDVWLCSIDIQISFKRKNGMRTVDSKDAQTYPCSFFRDTALTPEQLVSHLNKSPNEIPFWRLSPEEQNKRLNISRD